MTLLVRRIYVMRTCEPKTLLRQRISNIGCVPISLPVLKIYSARNVYYRFSVLAVIQPERSH